MISVIGSINLDLVVRVAELPQPGETIPGHDFERLPGGKGANQALAVMRAGGELSFHGAVGNDAFAQIALSELEAEQVDLSHIEKTNSATGIAMILVSAAGENVIAIVSGANAHVDAKMAEKALNKARSNDFVLLQQEIPSAAIKTALILARAKGATSILNIAPIIAETSELAGLADIIIANETEFAALAGISVEIGEALQNAILNWAREKSQTIIVTLGGDGVVAANQQGDFFKQASLDVTPVDTVGAGDTFCGYLTAALHQGLALNDALHRAAVAGSLACLKPGAQPAIPYAKDVKAALVP